MTADALATGLYALGRKEGLQVAEEHKLAVIYVEADGDSTRRSHRRRSLNSNESDFVLGFGLRDVLNLRHVTTTHECHAILPPHSYHDRSTTLIMAIGVTFPIRC